MLLSIVIFLLFPLINNTWSFSKSDLHAYSTIVCHSIVNEHLAIELFDKNELRQYNYGLTAEIAVTSDKNLFKINVIIMKKNQIYYELIAYKNGR